MNKRFAKKFGNSTCASACSLWAGIAICGGLCLANFEVAFARQQTDKDQGRGNQSAIDKSTETKPNPGMNSAEDKGDDSKVPVIDAAVDPVIGLTYSDPVTVKWKVGVKISAGPTDAQNVYIAIPVPSNWPEQEVNVDSEEMPPSVGSVAYANLKGGLRRQLIKIPVLRARETMELTTIFKVSTHQIHAPPNPSRFIKADSKLAEAEVYLEKTRYISFHNSKIREQISTLVAEKKEAWKEVEAIYDWVRNNIDQKEMPNTDTLKTFRKKEGSEEDKVALFVAMCRSHKIPARIVWVDGGCYAEFMLVDSQARPHWFPCNVSGIREFGSISEPRIVLQKGENFKVPEKKERQKFVAEHLSCQGTSRPVVAFVRELLPNDE
jgi:hypothetical protein